MRTQDIKIGKWYRLFSSPRYGYVKPLEILKRGQKGNPANYTTVKCEHVVDKSSTVGFIRYIRLCDLIKEVSNE